MVNLVIPPVSDCFMPTLGVAQIAGYLKKNNICCRVIDASAEFVYDLFLKIKGLSPVKRRTIIDNEQLSFRNVVSCLNYLSSIQDEFCITIDDFRTGFSWRDIDNTVDFVNRKTIFHERIKNLSFMNIPREMRNYYCFSISYESQVIPSLVMAKIIKEKYPEIKVCVGGSLLYNYEKDFYKLLYFTEWIDYLIIGAGELVYAALEIGGDKALSAIPNVNVVSNYGKHIVDARKCCLTPVVYDPDFSDIDFEIYPTVAKAFPYMIRDKCYYGKCYFCNGDRMVKQNNTKEIEKAFKKIEGISTQIQVENAYLVDAALSPADFRKIAAMCLKHKINWIANGRFEEQLLDEELIKKLSENGCSMLRFGLESGSQKVLDYMNKGTKIKVAEKILRLTAMYGIKNHIYIMFGYPGEGSRERKETLKFIDRNKNYIHSYSVSVFQPIPGTHVYNELLDRVSDKENEYQSMIDMIYSDEEDYQRLHGDIIAINSILKNYAKTNLEFYSANIFNGTDNISEEKSHRKLIFEKKIFSRVFEKSCHIKDKIYVTEKVPSEVRRNYVAIDFYKNMVIYLNISKQIVEDYNNRIYEKKQSEFLKIVEEHDFEEQFEFFDISNYNVDIAREMSIQFMP